MAPERERRVHLQSRGIIAEAQEIVNFFTMSWRRYFDNKRARYEACSFVPGSQASYCLGVPTAVGWEAGVASVAPGVVAGVVAPAPVPAVGVVDVPAG